MSTWRVVLAKAFVLCMASSLCLQLGCATGRLAKPLPSQSLEWKKVALVEQMILSPSLPIVPLVQSGIYRGLYSGIENEVLKTHQDKAEWCEDVLGKGFAKHAPFTVLHGTELMKIDKFKNLDTAVIRTFDVASGGPESDGVVIPPRGYNFFNFREKKVDPKNAFGEKNGTFLSEHAGSLSALCKTLECDSVLVATLYVETPTVNFIAMGPRNLMLTLAFFSRDGKLVHSTTEMLKGDNSTGGDLEAYKKILDKYPMLVDQMVQRVVDGQKKSSVK